MTAKSPATQQELPFRAILHPHRSLGPTGFLILMLAIGGVSFVTGMVFLLMGAWPVFGFFGLDVALVYLAFRLNYRSGRLYETVELTPEALTVTRVHPSGKRESFDFNPYWVRVEMDDPPEHGSQLTLWSHGKFLRIGQFLAPEERARFATILKTALIRARQPSP